jgi:hypothetical protein
VQTRRRAARASGRFDSLPGHMQGVDIVDVEQVLK